jgi:glycosyltransferase involved in cell wall biosynthesis
MSETNLILLAYYYLPDNTSGVQRAVRLAKYLPRLGYHVDVVSSSHAGLLPETPGVHHVPSPEYPYAAPVWTWLARIIQRVIPYNEQVPWVPHAVAAATQLVARKSIAAVISTSPPLASHLAGLALKWRFGLKWIADFRDPVSGNPGRARRWAKPYDAAVERLIFANCDAVVGVTDAVVDGWKKRHPRLAPKFHLIWNGFDPDDSVPETVPSARSYRLLSHIGVLYEQRHPRALLTALDRLVTRGALGPERIRLRLLGPTQGKEALEAFGPASSLIKRTILEIDDRLIPRKQALQETADADGLLLLDINDLSNSGYTVPAKLYDYLQAGRPILAVTDSGSPVERILSLSGIPFVCLYHTDADSILEQKLLEFLALPTDRAKPSDWFAENFDGSRQVDRWAALLRPGSRNFQQL